MIRQTTPYGHFSFSSLIARLALVLPFSCFIPICTPCGTLARYPVELYLQYPCFTSRAECDDALHDNLFAELAARVPAIREEGSDEEGGAKDEHDRAAAFDPALVDQAALLWTCEHAH